MMSWGSPGGLPHVGKRSLCSIPFHYCDFLIRILAKRLARSWLLGEPANNMLLTLPGIDHQTLRTGQKDQSALREKADFAKLVTMRTRQPVRSTCLSPQASSL